MPAPSDVLAGRYELQEVIASGGMATVWLAHDQVLARTVAVKVLHEHLAEDATFLDRFRREAIAAAGLSHPHVVSIYDTGEMEIPESTCHYIVMEHCGGGTLSTMLDSDGPFLTDRVATVGTTICDALAYAHSKGIVHRDVKPANVLIGDDGLLKVGDFGIAKAVSEKNDLTTTGRIMGTVAYISPEYATDKELDARSDIYSLGVVLYELAVGKPPFLEETSVATAMRHVNDQPPPPRSRRAGISRALELVILKALEKDPGLRFDSAAEMGEALQRLAPVSASVAAQTTGTRTIRVDERTSFKNESRWILPVVALIVGAIVLAALAAAVFNDASPIDKRGIDAGGGEDAAIRVKGVSDFDPYGGGEEHSEDARLAIDGNPGSAWTTESYSASFDLLNKPGVGLLFDLGDATDVTRVQVTTAGSTPLELYVGDAAPSDVGDLQKLSGGQSLATGTVFSANTSGRYWLVWITELPGGSGSASIAEVKFFGR